MYFRNEGKIQKFPFFCMNIHAFSQFLSMEKSSSLSYLAYESSKANILLIYSMALSMTRIFVYACSILIK